jgi:hypothetical protein
LHDLRFLQLQSLGRGPQGIVPRRGIAAPPLGAAEGCSGRKLRLCEAEPPIEVARVTA